MGHGLLLFSHMNSDKCLWAKSLLPWRTCKSLKVAANTGKWMLFSFKDGILVLTHSQISEGIATTKAAAAAAAAATTTTTTIVGSTRYKKYPFLSIVLETSRSRQMSYLELPKNCRGGRTWILRNDAQSIAISTKSRTGAAHLGDFPRRGGSLKWMVYQGQSILKLMR